MAEKRLKKMALYVGRKHFICRGRDKVNNPPIRLHYTEIEGRRRFSGSSEKDPHPSTLLLSDHDSTVLYVRGRSLCCTKVPIRRIQSQAQSTIPSHHAGRLISRSLSAGDMLVVGADMQELVSMSLH